MAPIAAPLLPHHWLGNPDKLSHYWILGSNFGAHASFGARAADAHCSFAHPPQSLGNHPGMQSGSPWIPLGYITDYKYEQILALVLN